MSSINFTTDRAHFETLLRDEGIFAAMRFINSKSAHRFTALYAFDGPILNNICLVDKEDKSVRKMDAIEVTDSYCLYVRQSQQKFIVPDSFLDERVRGHVKQETIQSYCGMPLMNAEFALLGTLCHFDFTPLSYTDEEVALLEIIAPALTSWLQNNR